MGSEDRSTSGTQAAEPRAPSATDSASRVLVAYTRPAIAREALASAETMTAGLGATIALVAVHVIPYPAPFHFPELVREHLENRLGGIVKRSGVSAGVTLAVARSEEEGFRHLLAGGGTILIGTYRRFWRTREERLARRLERCGCNVLLVELGGDRG